MRRRGYWTCWTLNKTSQFSPIGVQTNLYILSKSVNLTQWSAVRAEKHPSSCFGINLNIPLTMTPPKFNSSTFSKWIRPSSLRANSNSWKSIAVNYTYLDPAATFPFLIWCSIPKLLGQSTLKNVGYFWMRIFLLSVTLNIWSHWIRMKMWSIFGILIRLKETSESMSFLKRKIKDSSPQLPVRKVNFGLSERAKRTLTFLVFLNDRKVSHCYSFLSI